MLCTLVEVYQSFKGMYCLHLQCQSDRSKQPTETACLGYSLTLKMEVVQSSETSVNLYQATWCNIPKDNALHVDKRDVKQILLLSVVGVAGLCLGDGQ
jgi:hypothetical protein